MMTFVVTSEVQVHASKGDEATAGGCKCRGVVLGFCLILQKKYYPFFLGGGKKQDFVSIKTNVATIAVQEKYSVQSVQRSFFKKV